MKQILYILPLIFGLYSCTEIIELNIKNASPALVIEANLASDSVLTVKLSKSIKLSDEKDFPIVSDAIVFIEQVNGLSEMLIFQDNGKYVSSIIKGAPGESYQLQVITNNKTLSSISTMPLMVPFQEINIEKRNSFGFSNPNNMQNETEAYYDIKVKFSDPPEENNFYRFVEFINGEKIREYLYDDRLNNGNLVEFELFRFNRLLKQGDAVKIEMQNLSKEFYVYLATLNELRLSARTGSTPANPLTNITNGTLGYFNTYTVQSYDFVIE